MKMTGPCWKHFVLLLAAFGFQLSAFGQGADSGQQSAVSVPPDLLTGLIQSLAAKYPWLTSVVAFIGLFRILAKPACMWLERRAAETPDAEDDLLLARLHRSTPVRVLDFFLDLGLSVKRDVVMRAVKGAAPLALALAFSLQLSAFSLLTGCATWDNLSPNQQAAAKAAAKLALSFGVSQLGDSVKEVRPYQDALWAVINATFSAADDGETIGAALSEGVRTVVKDPALREQVLKALKAQLAAATESGQRSAVSGQQKLNAAIASAL